MTDAATLIPATVKRDSRSTITVTWPAMAGTSTGQAVDLSDYPDRNIHVFGTFGSATITLYGSDDPRVDTDRIAGTLFGSKTGSWVILTDTGLTNIAISSSDGLKPVLENSKWVSPVASGGTGTALTVVIQAQRKRI